VTKVVVRPMAFFFSSLLFLFLFFVPEREGKLALGRFFSVRKNDPEIKIFSSFFAPKKNEKLGLFGQLSHTVHANTNTTNPELPPLGVLFAWGKAVKTQKRKEEKKRHQPPLFLSRTRTHARARFFFGSLYLYLSVCVHSIRFYVVRERAARDRVCVLE